MRVKGIGALLVLGGLVTSVAAHAPTVRTFETRIVKKAIPRTVSYQISRTVRAGRQVVEKKGKDGYLITTYRVTFLNGKPIAKLPVASRRVEPVADVVLMGKPTFSTSRSSFARSKTMTVSATAYDCGPVTLPGSSGRTATGLPARFGVIAVDPRVIKLGTYVFVEGYGFAIAADTGGAIKGNKIDVCFNTRRECLNWGRRNVKIHILK